MHQGIVKFGNLKMFLMAGVAALVAIILFINRA